MQDDAERAYRTAIALDPSHIDAYTNLGILLTAQNRAGDAAACYCKVITLRPKHRDARKLLALAHCMLGDVAEAVRIFEDWLAEQPDDPIARHMLAACTGRNVPVRASDTFVETTFDGFAASFESKLHGCRTARRRWSAPCSRMPACAPAAFRCPRRRLRNGVVRADPRALRASARRCGFLGWHARAGEGEAAYDELIQAELTDHLRGQPAALDLIVSADALCYFGDLEGVFAAAAGALRANGWLVFTLELAVGREPDQGYRLELHGRYSHSRAYVEGALRGAGLCPYIADADLRMEAGARVAGLVVRASRADARAPHHAAPA